MYSEAGISSVREFEYKVVDYCGAEFCLSTCNATIAIMGVFYALGLSNTEVITTPLSWSGALSGLIMLNCKIKFCDVESQNLTIDPDCIEKSITPETKAIFSADFLGYPARLDKIKQICTKHNLLLIHDAASSFGTRYNNFYSGHYADVTILSFGSKKIFNIGEGGCILTDNSALFDEITKVLMHPCRQKIEKFSYNPFSLNSNINPIAADLAVNYFNIVIKNVEQKRQLVVMWLLENMDIQLPSTDEPNFYRIIVPRSKLTGLDNLYNVHKIPFDALIFNMPNWNRFIKQIVNQFPKAESVFDQYSIISIL